MPLLGLPLPFPGFELAALPPSLPLLGDPAPLLGLSPVGLDPAEGEEELEPDEEEEVDGGEEDVG